MKSSVLHYRPLLWARKNLFNSLSNSLVTIALGVLLFKLGFHLIEWAIIDSSWSATANECRNQEGACWSFVREKARYILFGTYPYEEQWRAVLFVATFLTLFILTQFQRYWSRNLIFAWIGFPIVLAIVMRGGFWGLPLVEIDEWGGLPLTLLLSLLGITLSYPIGIALALGRKSELSIVRSLSVAYIEFIRGVPLISVLFMAAVMFPLFLPEGITVSKVLRAQTAIILFSAAYMAEVVRGGLQAIPRGQYEAADAIGLNYAQKMGLVILPQALKIVIPPTVNTFIGLFKDTSLVFIISLSDLMFTTKAAFKDSEWLGFTVEGYVFTAFIYFIFCYFMSRTSSRLEAHLAH